MRLIDADDIEYEHIYGEFRVSEEKINSMPTVCDIDAIRQEIKELKPYAMYADGMVKKSEILQIIDRHMKGESDAT